MEDAGKGHEMKYFKDAASILNSALHLAPSSSVPAVAVTFSPGVYGAAVTGACTSLPVSDVAGDSIANDKLFTLDECSDAHICATFTCCIIWWIEFFKAIHLRNYINICHFQL